ncbi:MAG: transglutaminase-like cysteine peptidase [Sulfurimonadaceae bacterium]|nr:transglutaminase-like cysteine peptidase [Sulfurimonadaceae bacterium]
MRYLKHLPLFIWIIVMLTSCAKKPVVEEPVVVPGMISEAIMEQAQQKYGIFARNRYAAFNAMLLDLQERSTLEQLEAVNNFYNKVPHGEDIDVWGISDYWATPLEFLGKDKGDCEDYVIAKYFALRDLGIESDKLYFSYVKSIRFDDEHMVLSYFPTPTSIPLVLDNTNYKIFPADQRNDLIPVYNFNMNSMYRAGESGRNGHRLLLRGKNLHRWEQLISDIERGKL